jgi:hypothetical protein
MVSTSMLTTFKVLVYGMFRFLRRPFQFWSKD